MINHLTETHANIKKAKHTCTGTHTKNTCMVSLRQHKHYVDIGILCTHSHITVCLSPKAQNLIWAWIFFFFFSCIKRLRTHNVSQTPIKCRHTLVCTYHHLHTFQREDPIFQEKNSYFSPSSMPLSLYELLVSFSSKWDKRSKNISYQRITVLITFIKIFSHFTLLLQALFQRSMALHLHPCHEWFDLKIKARRSKNNEFIGQ